jgi:hypothetical protein
MVQQDILQEIFFATFAVSLRPLRFKLLTWLRITPTLNRKGRKGLEPSSV